MRSSKREFLIGNDDHLVVSKKHIKHTLEDVRAKRQGKVPGISTDRDVILNEIDGNEYHSVEDGMFMLAGSPPKAYAYFHSFRNKLVFFDTDGTYEYTFDNISGVVEDPEDSDWSEPSPAGYREEDYSLLSRPPVEVRSNGHPGAGVYHWDHRWAKVGIDLVDSVFASTPTEGWRNVESIDELGEHRRDDPLGSVKIELDGKPTDDHNNLEIDQDNVTIQALLTPEKAIELYAQLGNAISKGLAETDTEKDTKGELRDAAVEASRKLTIEPSDPDSA